MTISAARRRQTEDSIRTAIDRLLRGQIPAGAGCDVKTLAQEAGVSRAALYRSYGHLTEEFERRLTQMRAEGHLPDLKSVQIVRLKDENNAIRLHLLVAARCQGSGHFSVSASTRSPQGRAT